MLAALGSVLAERGSVYAHNTWGQQDIYPMHHDHSIAWAEWCEAMGLEHKGGSLWQR